MTESYKGVILVGGPSKGTVFRPLSLDVPKPLLPVGGVEMIGHQIHALSKIPNMAEIIIIGFYGESSFQNFTQVIEETYNIPCKYFQEKKALGTAGGIFEFKDQIFDSKTSTIFVLHCDICSHFPLTEMLKFHLSHGKICTIMSVEVPVSESKNYGCFIKDKKSNQLIHYAEKPESSFSNLINCGIYIFTKDLFKQLQEAKEHKLEETSQIITSEKANKLKNLFKLNIADTNSLSLERDIIMPLVSHKQVHLYQIENQSKDSFWFQIKGAGAVLQAGFRYLEYYEETDQSIFKRVNEAKLLLPGKVLIHESAEVDRTAKIGPNVTIGAGAKIGAGVRISNSIILDGAEVMPSTYISNSIIGWNSVIGRWARIVGLSSAEKPHPGNEGITILGVGVTVEAEVFISNCIVLPYKNLAENHHGEILL